jgi:DNA adenine methylase
MPFPKPLIKWVGGKTQLLDKLSAVFPPDMQNYHEIFLGGGSVLLMVLQLVKDGKIRLGGNVYAYDINRALIHLYKNIQSDPEQFYTTLQMYIGEYQQCLGSEVHRKPTTKAEGCTSKESYYYWIRYVYNNMTEEERDTHVGSAMFLFLNKTCFRGLYRMGPRGFNVPYGHYKNPEIIHRDHLLQIHALIQGVEFICCDFTVSLPRVLEGDFTYLDPPYAPINETSFVGYTDDGFGIEKHRQLFALIHAIPGKMVMSNADVELVKNNFTNRGGAEKYRIDTIVCKRSINSKNPGEKVNEVIISS